MNPAWKLIDRVCTHEQTKAQAQEFLSVLKQLRPSPIGTSSLPRASLTICAYLASECTQELDVSPEAAFASSKLPNLKVFSQSIVEVDQLLCEAVRCNIQSSGDKFLYSRLTTNSPKCRRCDHDGIPCFALRKVVGKRETDACFACLALNSGRPCEYPEVIDLLDDDDFETYAPVKQPQSLSCSVKSEPTEASVEDIQHVPNATTGAEKPYGSVDTPYKYREALPMFATVPYPELPPRHTPDNLQLPSSLPPPMAVVPEPGALKPYMSSLSSITSHGAPASSPAAQNAPKLLQPTVKARPVPSPATITVKTEPSDTPSTPLAERSAPASSLHQQPPISQSTPKPPQPTSQSVLPPTPMSVKAEPSKKPVANVSPTKRSVTMPEPGRPNTPSLPQIPSKPCTPRIRKPTDPSALPATGRVKQEGEKRRKVAAAPKKRDLDIPTDLLPVFDDDHAVTIPLLDHRRTSTGDKRFSSGVKEETTPSVKKKKRKLGLFTSVETVTLPPLGTPERKLVSQAPLTPRATPPAKMESLSANEVPMDVDPPTPAKAESLSASISTAVAQRSPISAPVPGGAPAPRPFQQPSPVSSPPATAYVPTANDAREACVTSVRAKAYEIASYVDKHGCRSYPISFSVSDMKQRLVTINRQEASGSQDNVLMLKEMLLKAGQDVVVAFQAEGTNDPVLECLIHELDTRLRRMASIHELAA